MGEKSKIEWTGDTINVLTGCTKVSPGCDNCYMFRDYPRLRGYGVNGYSAAPDVVTMLPDRLGKLAGGRNRVVFVNSMSDTFHTAVPDAFIDRMFLAMASNPSNVYQVLTKRPNRVARWWAGFQKRQHQHAALGALNLVDQPRDDLMPLEPVLEWPRHIWLGTSVESQIFVGRIDRLLEVPAPTRFVSAEPLLGPVDIRPYLTGELGRWLNWVIVGGESGPGARPMQLHWVWPIVMACNDAGVPVFVKQLGSVWAKSIGAKDSKGGNPEEWPAALGERLRELPDGIDPKIGVRRRALAALLT